MYARGAAPLPSKAEEKAMLQQRMFELESELCEMRRSVLGVQLALPALGSIHADVVVTAHSAKGAFVAGEFGAGYIHASEMGRRAVQLRRSGTADVDDTFAVLGDQSQALTVMGGRTLMEALLPIGRTVVAEVTSIEGGQVYLSMRDVDQGTGARREPLRIAPALGETVQCVVAHVNELPGGQPWAICKLPEFYDEVGGVVEGFLARSDQFLGGRLLQPGDALQAEVVQLPSVVGGDSGVDECGGKRLRLRVGWAPRPGAGSRGWAKRTLQRQLKQGQKKKQKKQKQAAKREARHHPGTLSSAIAKARARGGGLLAEALPSIQVDLGGCSEREDDYVLHEDGSFEWRDEPAVAAHAAAGSMPMDDVESAVAVKGQAGAAALAEQAPLSATASSCARCAEVAANSDRGASLDGPAWFGCAWCGRVLGAAAAQGPGQ